MIAVADTFDAMYSTRPYRKKLPIEKIIAEIKRCSGTQLDPKVVKVFLELAEEGAFDADREPDEPEEPETPEGDANNNGQEDITEYDPNNPDYIPGISDPSQYKPPVKETQPPAEEEPPPEQPPAETPAESSEPADGGSGEDGE